MQRTERLTTPITWPSGRRQGKCPPFARIGARLQRSMGILHCAKISSEDAGMKGRRRIPNSAAILQLTPLTTPARSLFDEKRSEVALFLQILLQSSLYRTSNTRNRSVTNSDESLNQVCRKLYKGIKNLRQSTLS